MKRDRRLEGYSILILVFAAFLLAGAWGAGERDSVPVSADLTREAGPFPGFPVDLNAATEADLVKLPGVGEVTARRILDKKSELGGFTEVEELREVKWIGPEKLARLRPLVVAGSALGPSHP